MTQKERLVDLLDNMPSVTDITIDEEGNIIPNRLLDTTEDVADYLLSNGVIVPPCKVGDTVYWLCEDEMVESKIEDIQFVDRIQDQRFCPHGYISFDSFDETVWLAREAAEQALKEREARGTK